MSDPTEVWYAAYGSNLSVDRLGCYLAGGRPSGATRDYVGARDRTMPRESRPLDLAGAMYFAWHSPTWNGGISFYDAAADDTTAATAYRVTVGQLSDLHAQEMHRDPGTDLDLTDLLAAGSAVLGPGRYETLHVVDRLDGLPVVTFTATWPDAVPYEAPVPAYLATIARGLREQRDWTPDRVADYLLARPGIGAGWTRASVLELVGP